LPCESKRTVARIMTLIAAFIWGTSFVVIRWGLLFISPMKFVFLRFLIAFIIFMLLSKFYFNARNFSKILFDRLILIAGIFNALGYIFQFIGQAYTYATNASLLVNLSSVFVAIIAHFLLGEKLTIFRASAIFLAFIGTLLLITELSSTTLFQRTFIGDLICLLSGLSWAFYIVLSKKIAYKEINEVLLLAVWFFYVVIFSAPFALLESSSNISFRALVAVLYTSIFCTAIAFLLWFKGLKILEAVTSSVYFLIEIVISAILEAIIFGLSFSIIKIIGAVLICVGIVLIDVSYHK